jgi:hypothetical protein
MDGMTETSPMYIRFGGLPEDGRSWNDDLQQHEPGVSVYRAEWQSSDRDIVCVEVPRGAEIGTVDLVADRPVYVVTGDLLGWRGGDGEPLLTNCRVVEVLPPVEAVTYSYEED